MTTPKDYHIIIGTKAQLVKMAPVIRAFDQYGIPYKLVFTGQHQETMEDLLSSFNIRSPDICLYQSGESDTSVKLLKWFMLSSGSMLSKRKYFQSSQGFIVHGDTLSTLWGAIFGKLFGIKVIHIEAGLRSFNLFRPFPEEIIRHLVTFLSDTLFAPNSWALNNIKSNKKKKINTQFNTILDSLRYALTHNTQKDEQNKYLVVSVHRVENVMSEQNLNVVMKLVMLSSTKCKIKMVLHPVTKKRLQQTHWFTTLQDSGVEMINRMTYVDFMKQLLNSAGLLTDGGSNQEEAALLGLPCLILRKETERQEGLNTNITLSSLSKDKTLQFLEQALKGSWEMNKLPEHSPSEQIVHHLTRTIDK